MARRQPYWLAFFVSLAGLAASFLMWGLLRADQRRSISRVIAAQSNAAAYEVALRLQTYASDLRGMAERWDESDYRNQERWENDASLIVNADPAIQAIEWVDPSGHVRWIMPLAGNEPAQGFDLTREERRRTALLAARSSGRPTLSRTINLVQGGKGTLLFVPILAGGESHGYILGVFRVNTLMDRVLDRQVAPGCGVTLYEGPDEIYSRATPQAGQGVDLGSDTVINVHGISWRLRAWPGVSLLRTLSSPVNNVLLGAAISVSLLFGFLVHDVRKRTLVERARPESEERFRTVTERAPVAIGMARQGLTFYVNSKYLEMYGFENVHEVWGRPIGEQWAPEYRAEVEERARQRYAGLSVPAEYEGIGLRKDGSRFPVQAAVTLVDLPDGPAAVAFLTDLTDRRKSEEQLRKLSRAVEQSAAAVIITDTAGNIEYVNPSFCRVTGYAPNEVLGKNPRILKSGELSPNSYHELWETITSGREWRGEFHNKRKDGALFWESAVISPIFDDQGQITHFVAVKEDLGERKRAEAALRDSEARFRRIFEEGAIGIAMADADYQFIEANPALCRMLGYSEAELKGMTVRDVSYPDDMGRDETEEMGMLLGEAGVYRAEKRFIRKDRSIVWAAISVTPLRAADGTFRYFLGTAEDITERKKAEKVREATYRISEAAQRAGSAHELFRFAHEIVSDLMPVPNFHIAFGDPASETLRVPYFVNERDPLSSPKLSIRGLTGFVIRTGESLLASREVVDNLLARGEIELVGAHSVDWLGAPLKTPDRTIGAVVVQTYTEGERFTEADRDLLTFVANQLAIAIERKVTEERYRRVLEAVVEGLYLFDADTKRIVESNSSLQRMLGYSADELAGRPVYEIIAHEKDSIDANVERVLGAPPFVVGERQYRRKDGSTLAVEVAANVVREADRTLVAASVHDISERRSLEERFRQSQKMEAVGRLAGGIAHDFNNILTTILGYEDLTASTLPPESPLKANLEEIRQAAERAANLTRQLLAFSRKQVLQPKVLDLNVIIEGLNRMLHRLIGEDITLTSALASGLWPVKADPGQIEQVMMNLAVNARDAMPKGGELAIETANIDVDEAWLKRHPEAAPGRYVLLSVSDSGIGMDSGTRRRLFEPFFTTKEPGKGTGLGLATVYGIVTQSGGVIEVDSTPGKGTRFRIYLPVAEGAAGVSRSGSSLRAARGTETVLVVEDERAVRNLTVGILKTFGYTVLEAEQPVEALRLCREHPRPIRLLLTDVVMPEMNGQELARQCLALRPDLRVLFISGYTADAVVLQRFAEPGLSFLPKPFTPASLALKVREVLDSQG